MSRRSPISDRPNILHSYTGEEQLFNLADDPGELVDLAKDAGRAREVARWREHLVRHLSERGGRS